MEGININISHPLLMLSYMHYNTEPPSPVVPARENEEFLLPHHEKQQTQMHQEIISAPPAAAEETAASTPISAGGAKLQFHGWPTSHMPTIQKSPVCNRAPPSLPHSLHSHVVVFTQRLTHPASCEHDNHSRVCGETCMHWKLFVWHQEEGAGSERKIY